MTREEAIKIVQSATVWTDEEREALSMLIPELAENEDERLRREIISALKFANDGGVYDKHIAYLENLKDRLAPIYEDIDSFESALEKAWKDYDEGYRRVDCLEDDYVECAYAKGFREGFLFGIGKQKEQKPVNMLGNVREENILPKDIERDATQFCFDKGINITPHQAWLIASHYQVMGFNAGMDEAHIQAKEAIKHPEKYGLQKEKKETVNIDHFKSFMLQYLQEAANRKDDSEIEADTDKWAQKLLSLIGVEPKKPVVFDEDTELGLDRALQVVKSARGNLCGYQSDDGIYECDHAIGVLKNILNNGMAQKVTEWSEEQNVNGGAKSKRMTEEDFKSLRNWLVEHGYYVGNHNVAEALRKLADMWDD